MHGSEGAERLLLHDPGITGDVREDRRGEVVRPELGAHSPAPEDQLSSSLGRVRDHALDASDRVTVDDRAHLGTLLRGISHDQTRDLRRECLQEAIQHRGGDQKPLRGGAHLARERERPADGGVDRRVERSVLEDDHGVHTPQLEQHLLSAGPRPFGHPATRIDRAGERHQTHRRMRDEGHSDLPTGTEYHVEHARRKSGVEGYPGQGDPDAGPKARRLRHDGVPGGERRSDLVGKEIERKVEGRDRDDHAEGLASGPDHPPFVPGGVGIGVRRVRSAGLVTDGIGRHREDGCGPFHLDPGLAKRLTHLGDDLTG